jgi:response regulator RpfG family c-di-GMP phosphodiesterase
LGSDFLGSKEETMALPQPQTAQLSIPIFKLQAFLKNIDDLQLPPASQREMERQLSEQAATVMESFTRHNPGHGRRTAGYSVLLGRTIGLSPEELHDLALAGLLHDVGLLMLEPTLLASPDTWDAKDYATVQSHPRIGAELLSPFAFLTSAAHLIAHHHERWDGSGYPFGLRGSFIPLGARVLAIADAYDAIQVPQETAPRVKQNIALRILTIGAGSQFDPTLVETFVSAVQPASRVRGGVCPAT